MEQDTPQATPPETGDTEHAVRVENLSFAYEAGGEPVLERVTLGVRAGERLGILGPNGGGKSTLLKLLLGTLRPSEGSVSVVGMPPAEARRAGVVGYLPQRVSAELRFPLRVEDVVTQPAAVRTRPWSRLSASARERAARCLEMVGAADLSSRRIGSLSGGQLQRVLIARAIAAEPRVLLLDEPTVGIDVSGQKRFGEMLDAVRTELGITVIVVSHELATIAATSDRVACLRRTLHFHDSPHGLTPEVLREVFQHDLAIFRSGGVNGAAHGACCDHDHEPGDGHRCDQGEGGGA